ncbi:MAG: hypothetical protein NC310_04890 [Roseburia sp.]|nr:hypothetical protein [Anaeroplasma bactoclasticum]MCM1196396.1 hypothetical protein [Roseburia sp.]MCM1556324.1 hypothetical protein [Anaeroplasma bactoclasticum]
MIKLFYSNAENFKYVAIFSSGNDAYLQCQNLIYLHFRNTYLYYNSKKELFYVLANGTIVGPSKPTIETKQYLINVHQELLSWIEESSYEQLEFVNLKILIKTIKKDKDLKENDCLNNTYRKKSNFRKIGVHKW